MGPVNGRQRAARATAGVALLGLAASAIRAPSGIAVMAGAAAGWVAVSHLVAAASEYNGCPELGAIPTLLLRRQVHTHCGPWQVLDARLGLTNTPVEAACV